MIQLDSLKAFIVKALLVLQPLYPASLLFTEPNQKFVDFVHTGRGA